MQMQNGFGTHEFYDKTHAYLEHKKKMRALDRHKKNQNNKNWNIHYVFCILYLVVHAFFLFCFIFSLTQWKKK